MARHARPIGASARSARPLPLLIRPNSRSSSFDRSSSNFGSTSRTSTTRSPRRPSRGEATPRSRSRNRWPDCVPGGTRTRAAPSSDGTSIFAPSAASWTATGTVDVQVVAFAPEQRMRLHADVDVEIAGLAAVAAGVPFPGTRIRAPSARPGGDADGHRLRPHLDLIAAARGTAASARRCRAAALRGTAWRTPCGRAPTSRRRRRDNAAHGAGVTCSWPTP